MTCKHCGSPLTEDLAFCGMCGAAVESEVSQAPVDDIPSMDENFFNDPVVVQPKKKKKALVPAVIALVVTAVAVTAAIVWANLFAEERLEIAEEDQLAYTFTHYSEDGEMFTDKLLEKLNSNMAYDMEMTVEVSEMITSMVGIDASEMRLTCDYDYLVDDKMAYKLDLFVGNSEIIGADVYLDLVNSTLVLDVPGYLAQPVQVNLSDMDAQAAEMFVRLMSSETVAEDIQMLETFMKIMYDSLKTVEFTYSDQALTAQGVSQTMRCLDVTMDAEQLRDFIVTVLQNVKNNAELKNYIVNGTTIGEFAKTENMNGEQLYQQLVDAVDELINKLNVEVDEAGQLTLKTWVDEQYDICGMKLNVDTEAEDLEVFYGFAEVGGQAGLELYVVFGGEEVFSLNGEGTIENDLLDMDIDVEAEGKAVLSVEVEDFQTTDDETCKGKLTFRLEGELEDGLSDALGGLPLSPSLVVEFDTTPDAATCRLSVNVSAVKVVEITLNTTESAQASVEMPTATTTDLYALENIDVDEILRRLERAGIPVYDLMDMLSGLQYDGMYQI